MTTYLVLGLLPFIFLLFPNGRLLAGRWRPVAWAAGLVGVVQVVHPGARPFRRAGVRAAWESRLVDAVTVAVLFSAMCAAIGIAVLKHRLYDIDRLLTRTLVYGLLTAAFTAVYLAIVVGIGTLVGSRGTPDLFLSILATAVVAVAFQPARDRSRRLANRLVYGKRATPYEVLSEFSRAMAGTATDDSLLRMTRLVVQATGAVQATVWLRLRDLLQPQARWPQVGPLPQPVALEGRGL